MPAYVSLKRFVGLVLYCRWTEFPLTLFRDDLDLGGLSVSSRQISGESEPLFIANGDEGCAQNSGDCKLFTRCVSGCFLSRLRIRPKPLPPRRTGQDKVFRPLPKLSLPASTYICFLIFLSALCTGRVSPGLQSAAFFTSISTCFKGGASSHFRQPTLPSGPMESLLMNFFRSKSIRMGLCSSVLFSSMLRH